ncbi:MAG: helix-turn-helix domain-containing protein [Desulfocapsaceae bacterium]|nr:helix-turn-helix domain-containing protein [Desulfocapsaceae bacterium]
MTNKNSQLPVTLIIEDIIGCKWSLSVLLTIQQGVCRPGELTRSIPGITTKVLNERLKKMVRYAILQKRIYPEVPPRVEYEFTEFGRKIWKILDDIRMLQKEVEERK